MSANKIFYIKLVHSIIFWFMAACLLYILYCGITRTFNWTLLLAISAILIEGLVLLFNHWQCPFTNLAKEYGDERGSVTDMFLPIWIARNVFKGSAIILAFGLILLGIRFFIGI